MNKSGYCDQIGPRSDNKVCRRRAEEPRMRRLATVLRAIVLRCHVDLALAHLHARLVTPSIHLGFALHREQHPFEQNCLLWDCAGG